MLNRFRLHVQPRALAIAGVLAILAVEVSRTSMQLAAQSVPTVVMSGLDNPRGMAFGPEGALYVAEAGRGPSDHSCFNDPSQATCICPTCFVNPTPEQAQQHTCGAAPTGTVCSGPTGAISRLWRGLQERVLTGLPSWASVA